MIRTHNLGFPRIGEQRELKFALEAHWRGTSDDQTLLAVGQTLRARRWQQQAGVELLPVGDFAWYDQVLNHCLLFGAIPARFGLDAGQISLSQQFQLARGNTEQPAMEMTKWFDTNYHYLAPEWHPDTRFQLHATALFAEIDEARQLGHVIKVVLIGPLTLLWLGKAKTAFDKLALLAQLLPEYQLLLRQLAEAGVEWVQLDEPILALDLPDTWRQALFSAYRRLALAPLKLLLATYFGSVAEHAEALASLPVAGVHLDLVRAPEQLATFAAIWPAGKVLSAGIVDGRNVWRSDLDTKLELLAPWAERLGAQLWLAPSCSLLHSPIDLDLETALDPELRSWLAFAVQKLDELNILAQALAQGRNSVSAALTSSRAAHAGRRASPRIHHQAVAARLASLPTHVDIRHSPYPQRIARQRQRLQLPLFPTTTIGSFPQTVAIRGARAAYRRGELGESAYQEIIRREIAEAIDKQLQLGLDVLVHGEAERNDMVEYFGEQLAGFAFTEHGWVQSYGSRCVKPPLIFGDVYRRAPMTVAWAVYAQSLTTKPVKGMLTGPVTLLQWSFVRDDIPRATTALQLALAVRDEVCDLEAAGIAVIQIDEPALREGLPLRRAAWAAFLEWAGRAFRISAAGVSDATQIHTHMCYAEFNDILPAIAALDADVITIETSRSDMELLHGFAEFAYPNDIGPGVYDIHSPTVPKEEQILRLLDKACTVIAPERLWVNPDCGLKTRGWAETETALRHMVSAARQLRQRHIQLAPV